MKMAAASSLSEQLQTRLGRIAMAKNSMDLLELLRKRGGVRRSRRLGRGRLTPEVGLLMEVAVPCDGDSPPFRRRRSWGPWNLMMVYPCPPIFGAGKSR